jgi:hypothetical protein
MKKQSIIYFLSFFTFVACVNNKVAQQEEVRNITDSTEISLTETYDALTAIHRTIDSVGLLTLPHKIHSGQNAIFIDDDRLKRYLLEEYDIPADGRAVYGVWPDTVNFYGLIVQMAVNSVNPYLITFDKKENFVDKKFLIEDNCFEIAGDVIFCDEYIQINEDFTLLYYYKTKHLYEVYDKHLNEIHDNPVCRHYEKKGHINKNGEIIFEVRQEFPVENCNTINQ